MKTIKIIVLVVSLIQIPLFGQPTRDTSITHAEQLIALAKEKKNVSEEQQHEANTLYHYLQTLVQQLPTDKPEEKAHLEYLLFELSTYFGLQTSAPELQEHTIGALNYLQYIWNTAKSITTDRAADLVHIATYLMSSLSPDSLLSLLSTLLDLPKEATRVFIKELYMRRKGLHEPSDKMRALAQKALKAFNLTGITILETEEGLCHPKLFCFRSMFYPFFKVLIVSSSKHSYLRHLPHNEVELRLYEEVAKEFIYQREVSLYEKPSTLIAGSLTLIELALIAFIQNKYLAQGFHRDFTLAYHLARQGEGGSALGAASRFTKQTLETIGLLFITFYSIANYFEQQVKGKDPEDFLSRNLVQEAHDLARDTYYNSLTKAERKLIVVRNNTEFTAKPSFLIQTIEHLSTAMRPISKLGSYKTAHLHWDGYSPLLLDIYLPAHTERLEVHKLAYGDNITLENGQDGEIIVMRNDNQVVGTYDVPNKPLNCNSYTSPYSSNYYKLSENDKESLKSYCNREALPECQADYQEAVSKCNHNRKCLYLSYRQRNSCLTNKIEDLAERMHRHASL